MECKVGQLALTGVATMQLQPLSPVIHSALVFVSFHHYLAAVFCSLPHTHNHAVRMNAHTNVTDCQTVTQTQQCFK